MKTKLVVHLCYYILLSINFIRDLKKTQSISILGKISENVTIAYDVVMFPIYFFLKFFFFSSQNDYLIITM